MATDIIRITHLTFVAWLFIEGLVPQCTGRRASLLSKQMQTWCYCESRKFITTSTKFLQYMANSSQHPKEFIKMYAAFNSIVMLLTLIRKASGPYNDHIKVNSGWIPWFFAVIPVKRWRSCSKETSTSMVQARSSSVFTIILSCDVMCSYALTASLNS